MTWVREVMSGSGESTEEWRVLFLSVMSAVRPTCQDNGRCTKALKNRSFPSRKVLIYHTQFFFSEITQALILTSLEERLWHVKSGACLFSWLLGNGEIVLKILDRTPPLMVAPGLPDQDSPVTVSQGTLAGCRNQATAVGKPGWYGGHWATLPFDRRRSQPGRAAAVNVSGPPARTWRNSSLVLWPWDLRGARQGAAGPWRSASPALKHKWRLLNFLRSPKFLVYLEKRPAVDLTTYPSF